MVKLLRPGSNGVADWLVQRVSAVILVLYVVFLIGIFCYYAPIDFEQWQRIFSCNVVRGFTLIALVSLLLHAWVGIWTVLTDYINCTCLRLTLEVLLVLSLFTYLIWGVTILWGVTT